jgi:hypothetical protein
MYNAGAEFNLLDASYMQNDPLMITANATRLADFFW